MKANPRISSPPKELAALPPGRLWWISRCSLIPDVVITFSDDKTPTWIFAKQFADIMWREHVASVYKTRILQDPFQLEKETQEALRLVTTDLWVSDT